MDFVELISQALEALKSKLGRTLLTMLGIIIGIASVIAIMSLGAGSTESIVSSIASFGTNVLTVSPGRSQRGPGVSAGTVSTLSSDDANAIEKLDNVSEVSRVIGKTKTISVDGVATNAQIQGVDASYQEIQTLTLLAGTFFSDADVTAAAKDVVLGDEVIDELFGEDAYDFVVGETVRIDGKVFQIVGVILENTQAFIPISTAQTILFGQTFLDSISVYIDNTEIVNQTIADIESLMYEQHDIADTSMADFSIRSSQSMIDTISGVTGTMTAMLAGIAAISLLVGGIGIMNIMLVTVTERTKEIGLLKAIGAKNKDILAQFLIESLVLTILGGIIGVILGAGIAYIASSLMKIPFIVRATSIGLSFGVSAGVGVLFGYYPAQKAAKLNPIESLRYE